MKKHKLEIVVFLSGAIGMGLELIAARVLSPYVGSSNIVWTSIIGIILVSMSLGYLLGGKQADKDANLNRMSMILLISAVFTSLIPLLEIIVVKRFAEMISNTTISAIICAIIVFSIPSFILAMIPPYAVKIRSKENEQIGSLSGRISSLSTLGSIVGTFLMGFLLIPYIGVKNIILCLTLLLILMSLIIRENINKKYILTIILTICVVLALVTGGKWLFKIKNPDILLDTDSQYSRIWIKRIGDIYTYKTLQVDTGLESYVSEQTGEMVAPYLRCYDIFEYLNSDAKSTLLIGGGAYTYPMHYLQKFEDKIIDVVEIDNKMTLIATEQFGLDINDNRLKIYNQDGRSYLNYSKKKYDTILIDAFKGLNVPFELTTYEALVNAKKALNENGVVITNIISSLEEKDSKFIEYEYATYKKVFDDVKILKISNVDKTEKQNLILVGIKGNPTIDGEKYTEYRRYLEKELKGFDKDKCIVTDDYAPIGN